MPSLFVVVLKAAETRIKVKSAFEPSGQKGPGAYLSVSYDSIEWLEDFQSFPVGYYSNVHRMNPA